MRSHPPTSHDPRALLALPVAFVIAACAASQSARGTETRSPPVEPGSFDPARIDAGRWGILRDRLASLRTRLGLGMQFFRCGGRGAFLEELRKVRTPFAARVEIGWVTPGDGRYVGTHLSRTPRQIEAMSDAAFVQWRRSWSVVGELEHRRFHPLPDELRGYGGPEARERVLHNLRLLMAAKDRDAFLASVEDRIENGYLSVLFPPKGGQGPTWYGFSVGEVAALDERGFRTWRQRFLRWVETHTPGQSRVRLFGTATDAAFEQLYNESKDRQGRHDIRRAFASLRERTGIRLRYPRFAEGRTAAVVASVAPGSEAARCGLTEGDTVLAVEGARVPDWDDFTYHLGAYRPDSIVALQVRTNLGTAAVRYFRVGPTH